MGTLQALVGAGGKPGGGHEQVLQVPGGVGQAQRDGGDSDQQETHLLVVISDHFSNLPFNASIKFYPLSTNMVNQKVMNVCYA